MFDKKTYAREWRLNHPKYHEQWRVGHKAELANHKRQYRMAHKMEVAKYAKQYMQKHPLCNIWRGMKTRCYNPNHQAYKWYGGRGVIVCDEWLSFKPFEEWCLDNGWQKGLTIDRIDNDDKYEQSNCQFITMSENSKKRWGITKDV